MRAATSAIYWCQCHKTINSLQLAINFLIQQTKLCKEKLIQLTRIKSSYRNVCKWQSAIQTTSLRMHAKCGINKTALFESSLSFIAVYG